MNHLLQRFTSVRLEGVGPGAAEDIFKNKYDQTNRYYRYSEEHCVDVYRPAAIRTDPRSAVSTSGFKAAGTARIYVTDRRGCSGQSAISSASASSRLQDDGSFSFSFKFQNFLRFSIFIYRIILKLTFAVYLIYLINNSVYLIHNSVKLLLNMKSQLC